jgi:hypothetical protein
MTVIDDLQQIASLLCGEWGQPSIVKDQNLNAGKTLEHAGIAAVAACQTQAFQDAGYALVEHRAVVATGSLPESTGKPCLAHADGAGYEQILLAFATNRRTS